MHDTCLRTTSQGWSVDSLIAFTQQWTRWRPVKGCWKGCPLKLCLSFALDHANERTTVVDPKAGQRHAALYTILFCLFSYTVWKECSKFYPIHFMICMQMIRTEKSFWATLVYNPLPHLACNQPLSGRFLLWLRLLSAISLLQVMTSYIFKRP